MSGLFDDLIPQPSQGGQDATGVFAAPAAAPAPKLGLFDDLVPIDFNRPVEAVRADVGKLSGEAREVALRQWGDAFVAREREQGGVGMMADNTVRTLARGSFVGPFLDEITAVTQAAQHALGLGGAPYDEALAYQRARDRAVDKDYPVASTVGQVAGGVAGGIGAIRGGSAVAGTIVGGPLATVTPAASTTGQMAQGAGIGATYGAASGFGNAEGGSGDLLDQAGNRAVGAGQGAVVGGVVGGAAPPVINGVLAGAGKVSDAVSVQTARYSQQLRNFLTDIGVIQPERQPTSAGAMAVGTPPAPISGAEAAADQVIANQLARGNVTVTDLRQRLAQAEDATRLNTNSRAQNALAPVDLDPSLQRLAGSVARQQPEAGATADSFIVARQTGRTPPEGPLPATAGLPTRETLSRAEPDAPPMGQFERVTDALRRSFGIADNRTHGHAPTAYQTEQRIVEKAREQANEYYARAYEAANGVDIQPVIRPVMEQWIARAAEEPRQIRTAIRKALAEFRTERGPVATLERFDKAKQALDDQIDKLFRGGDRYLGGLMTRVKNDMISAVDGVQTNRMGELYQSARDAFSSKMDMREALNLGRQLFNENSDVAIDQFRSLATEGERKLARLGIVDSFQNAMSRQKRTADVTQVFQSPRVQDILEVMIPRPRDPNAVFADRPQRFGRFLDSEGRMIKTRNEVLGNSKTAQRLADDDALNEMMGLVEQVKGASTGTGAVMKGVTAVLERMFGFRADTAAIVARKLFTADPDERQRVLLGIERRLGPSRSAQLQSLLAQYEPQGAAATGTTGGGISTPPQQNEPPRRGPPGQAPEWLDPNGRPGRMRLGGPDTAPQQGTPAGRPAIERGQRRDTVRELDPQEPARGEAFLQPTARGIGDAVQTYAQAVALARARDKGYQSDADMETPPPLTADEVRRSGMTLASLAMTGSIGATAPAGAVAAGLPTSWLKTTPGAWERLADGIAKRESPRDIARALNAEFKPPAGTVTPQEIYRWKKDLFPDAEPGFAKVSYPERRVEARPGFTETFTKLHEENAQAEAFTEAFQWAPQSVRVLRKLYAEKMGLQTGITGEKEVLLRKLLGEGKSALEIARALELEGSPGAIARAVNHHAEKIGLPRAPTEKGDKRAIQAAISKEGPPAPPSWLTPEKEKRLREMIAAGETAKTIGRELRPDLTYNKAAQIVNLAAQRLGLDTALTKRDIMFGRRPPKTSALAAMALGLDATDDGEDDTADEPPHHSARQPRGDNGQWQSAAY